MALINLSGQDITISIIQGFYYCLAVIFLNDLLEKKSRGCVE